ncbi:unnamed protein product [Closterium sp. Naga37s-1]|nr:unnamed protein product [Closterium sp. Naga37s-1]
MGKKKQAPRPAPGAIYIILTRCPTHWSNEAIAGPGALVSFSPGPSTSSSPAAQPTGATKRSQGRDPTATLQPPWLPSGRPRRQGLRPAQHLPAPAASGASPTSPPTAPHGQHPAESHQAAGHERRASAPAQRGGTAQGPSQDVSRSTGAETGAPHAQGTPTRPGPPPPTRSPTSPHGDHSANPCSTTPIAGPVRSQALQTRPTRGAARLAATTPRQESHQDVSHGHENQTQGQGVNARGKATAGEGATGGKDSQHPIEPRKDGTEEQGDAGAEAAGEKEQPEEERERREGLRLTARSKGKAPMEEAPTVEAQEGAQGQAGSEREPAQAEGAPGAAEAAGEGTSAGVLGMAAGERAHEEDGTAWVAMADGGDAGIDGRAGRGGAGSMAFDQGGGDTLDRRESPADGAAHGPIRRSIRLQPSLRRLGAGLAPGLPGPLWGWERQTVQPRPHGEGPSRPYPSSAWADEEGEVELPAEVPAAEDLRPGGAAGRARGRAWGRARGRAGTRGRRKRGRAVNARERVRSGPWRERHGRPEVVPEVVPKESNADRLAASDRGEEDEAYMALEEGESEEVSLEDEPGVGNHQRGGRSGRTRLEGNGRMGGDQQNGNPPPGAPIGQPGGAEVREMRPPEVIAGDEATWRQVAEWDMDCLRGSEQPFLARRMPPGVVDSLAACLVIPLQRLKKNPLCQGAWRVLLFLPRLTLRADIDPSCANHWQGIEGRLQQFLLEKWDLLFLQAKTVPDDPKPSRHQPDPEGLRITPRHHA